jgi:hypothetical protein
MKGKIRALAMGAAAAATIGASVAAGGAAAFAGGGGGPTPPWQSAAQANILGAITFYNAKGQVITGGSTTGNGLSAFAVASAAAPAGYTKATVYLYTPTTANPGTWSSSPISASTTFPNMSAPDPVGTTTNPVETNFGTDTTIQSIVAADPNTVSTAGYPGLYDVRMKVSGPGGLGTLPGYYDAVISVNTSNNTWSADFPDFTQTTTTALSANPPSPQSPPASQITLTATVSPATAGTVGFWSGGTQIGATQTVTGGNGVATVTTTPPTGTTPYAAIFTPTVGSADIGSASSTLNYVVAVPTPPVFEPVLSGTSKVGSTDTCVAGFQGATTVTWAWQSGGTTIAGATSQTFKIPATLLGDTLTCSVKATNTFGSVSGTSSGATVVLGAALVPTTKPAISGPHKPGGKETVTAGKWSPAATTVTFQWFLGTKKVAGATKSTFTVPASTKSGATVHCVVTASATGFAKGTFTTASVKIT